MSTTANRPSFARASAVSETDSNPGCRIWLYTSEGEDAAATIDSLPKLDDGHILWADVDLECAENLDLLWDELDIAELVEKLDSSVHTPTLAYHGEALELVVTAIRDADSLDVIPLHCVVGPNWIVTLHEGPLDLVDSFNKPLNGSSRLGELDSQAFLSMVLDWQITGYLKVIEELQADIDRIDEEILGGKTEEISLLNRLQALRSDLRHLRKTLAPHREILGLLGHPRAGAILGEESADDYQRLEDRLQLAMDAIDTTREMIAGSFDIFMTRTAQTTNDIMKRLTIVSVLLLPAAVIAGIMGMNFRVAFFDRPGVFWIVIAVMVLLAGTTLLVAKRRDWL